VPPVEAGDNEVSENQQLIKVGTVGTKQGTFGFPNDGFLVCDHTYGVEWYVTDA
jgi:hypothetical protein